MAHFMEHVRSQGVRVHDYDELYQWSVDRIDQFWEAIWEYFKIISSKKWDQVLDDPSKMPGAAWFSGARLNFAENLLRHRSDATALVFYGEEQVRRRLSYNELYSEVARRASVMKKAGIQAGDRIAGYMPNMPETIIAMLAATSLGAVWSSCSPDFGIQGVKDRFGQIQPKILFAADSYFFKGQQIDYSDRIRDVASLLPSLEQIVLVPYDSAQPTDAMETIRSHRVPVTSWQEFQEPASTIDFVQLPFSHPVYIMYSSGTTGLPKCMVQGPGVLLNHLKEHALHTNISAGDVVFYYTTCGWMMWNWLVSGLALGATLVLYDGSPFFPDGNGLWQMAAAEQIKVFGTSARYIEALAENEIRPSEQDLSSLETILSTGSPLSPGGFDFVYEHIKSDVQLASISGGTDLNGCFALGNPLRPVRRGELQGPGLGMAVDILDENGTPIRRRKGELVCRKPFVSMPLHFWNDEDGSKYHKAYFDTFPGIWRHGDFAELTEHDGVVVYGRSDATLNPGGVRIGTAELYNVVEGMEEVADSVVIGQTWKGDVRVVLFVQLEQGELTDSLRDKIKKEIRARVSPRHVPAKILQVQAIPYTINMKKVEVSVRNIVEGIPITNRDALKNPECLDGYLGREELQSD
jgi:acetoacetyl-CoA synthetase